jgi:hypothetical protein
VAGEKDVLDKADALLRRHGGSTPGVGSDTGGVPVLTDIVDDPLAGDPSGELAREVFQRVMAEVEGRLAADLESRLTQHIAPHLHALVADAINDLRQELASAIGDALAEAYSRRQAK